MGTCNSEGIKKEPSTVSIEGIFNTCNTPKDKKTPAVSPLIKSEFYCFTEWVLSFRFYNKLHNDDQSTKYITMTGGPNDKNIFKVIKSIDQIDGKNLSDFSSSSASQMMLTRHSIIGNQQSCHMRSNSDLKLSLVGLLERLAINRPKKIQKLLFIGPPNNLRWLIWISIAKSKYFEIQSQIGISNQQIYSYLINSSFPDESLETQIKKDLPRTKIDLKYFKSQNWLMSLNNVLKAIALYDDTLGYCIGMNELAACCLIVSDCNEAEAFNLLRFMYSSKFGLQLREFYINGFPKLKYYTYFVYELIKERLPSIYQILDREKILGEMWLQNWIQNLYSNLFEFSVGVRLWDCIIALGTDFLINFSLGYIKYFEEQILKCRDATDFLEIFKEKNKFKSDKEMLLFREKIIKLSLDFHISPETYKRINDKYQEHLKKEITSITVTTTNVEQPKMQIQDEVEKMKLIFNALNGGEIVQPKVSEEEIIPVIDQQTKIVEDDENRQMTIQDLNKINTIKESNSESDNEINNNSMQMSYIFDNCISIENVPKLIVDTTKKPSNFLEMIKEINNESNVVNNNNSQEIIQRLSEMNMNIKEEQIPRSLNVIKIKT